jgi:hypothetical protein
VPGAPGISTGRTQASTTITAEDGPGSGSPGPLWLVLCEPEDAGAVWAWDGLRAMGLPAALVTSAELAGARWVHRLGSTGTAVEATLADGRTIRSPSVRGVLNRLLHPAWPDLAHAQPQDREYAAQELMAFYMSWLRCLPGPAFNPATPQGLSGSWRHESQWAVLAAQAGLRTSTYAMGPGEAAQHSPFPDLLPKTDPAGVTLIVLGEGVVGDLRQSDIVDGCRALARLSQTPLLGVHLVEDVGGWTFVGATPHPELRAGGHVFLNVLSEALQRPVPSIS